MKKDEDTLVQLLKKSDVHKDFLKNRLKPKIDREKEAWTLLLKNRTNYSKEIINKIFDIVDHEEGKGRWFGSLLATPNRNLIFQTPIETINKWIDILLFSNLELNKRLKICLKQLKIKGASKGVVTLFLYLSDPKQYTVWVRATQQGLHALGRIEDLKGMEWDNDYAIFNSSAIKFRDRYGFVPQELDFVLWYFSKHSGDDGKDRVSIDSARTKPTEIIKRGLHRRSDRSIYEHSDEKLLDMCKDEIRAIRRFIKGKGSSDPSPDKAYFWIWFCYNFELFQEGVLLFRKIDCDKIPQEIRSTIRKLGLICEEKM